MKPHFFRDVDLIELSPLHRLLFAGLWCWADREGRLKDNPKQIKFDILPNDTCDCDQLLADLAERKFIIRYEFNGNKYLEVTNFKVHQNPHKNEVASEIPGPLASPREITGAEPPKADQILLIPDSLNLIPDSGFPQPAVAELPPAPQEEPNEQPLEFRDMLHRYVRRKGLKKPNKPVLDKAEITWQETAVGDTLCDAALDGFQENDWWKTAKEPLLGFVKDPRSWIPPSWKPSVPQRVNGQAKVVPMPTPATDAPGATQIDFPARWNELVPSKPVHWDTKRSAIDALLHAALDEVFVERFDEVCEIAQAIHMRCGPEADWLTFEFAIRRTDKGYGWWRILTEFRDMKPRKLYPESGQTDDQNYERWKRGEIRATNVSDRLAWVARYAAEGMAEDA